MPALEPARLTTLTFDCYGTLSGGKAGAIRAIRPLLARQHFTLFDDEIIASMGEFENRFIGSATEPIDRSSAMW